MKGDSKNLSYLKNNVLLAFEEAIRSIDILFFHRLNVIFVSCAFLESNL